MHRVAVAKILKPRGVRGEVWVERYRNGFPSFPAGSAVWVSGEPEAVPRRVQGFFEYAKGCVLKLEGVESPEAARGLEGTEIFLPGEQVPADGPREFEAGEVMSWPVRDARRGELGKVAGVAEGPAYWVFLVEGRDGREIEIPAVEGLGVRIDKAARRIEVALPEGYPGVDDAD